tara:strand:+ start:32660 stop:32887 length:228 start_codon:yes stop_codon:yes gene_type:complete
MSKLYYEYEIRDISSNTVINTIYVPENTDTKGWILGTWYIAESADKPRLQIKAKDNSKIATLIKTHVDIEDGDLF